MFGKTADKTKSCCVGDSCTGIKAVESLKKFHAAEMAKLQGQIDALKDATLREEPEKPMRTWKVTVGSGQAMQVKAQQFAPDGQARYIFSNEVPTGVVRVAGELYSVKPYLYRETQYVVVAEFMGVTSIIEVTE